MTTKEKRWKGHWVSDSVLKLHHCPLEALPGTISTAWTSICNRNNLGAYCKSSSSTTESTWELNVCQELQELQSLLTVINQEYVLMVKNNNNFD